VTASFLSFIAEVLQAKQRGTLPLSDALATTKKLASNYLFVHMSKEMDGETARRVDFGVDFVS
jgi:hypothetical protein